MREPVRRARMAVPDAADTCIICLPMRDADGARHVAAPFAGEAKEVGQPVDRGQLAAWIDQKADLSHQLKFLRHCPISLGCCHIRHVLS